MPIANRGGLLQCWLRVILVTSGLTVSLLGSARDSQFPTPPPNVAHPSAQDIFPPAHWRRASGAPLGSHYVGSQVCAGCHADIAEAQSQTPMAKASVTPLESLLVKHQLLAYRDGAFLIRIERQGDKEIYSVSDQQHSISVPILWAFGQGGAGQTYVFQRDGNYYESRVSYYNDVDGLDLTLGHKPEPSTNLAEALGRPLSEQEVTKCFPCHTSEDVINTELQVDSLQTGVTCENCHGPGSQHLEAVRSKQWRDLHIFNPGRLAPDDLNDFCATCHRSTRDVLESDIRGVRNVRFQPYRLENSRCYDPNDGRTSCLACHDPHVKLVSDRESYDSTCLACHIERGEKFTTKRIAPACPVRTKNCVNCHMPKLSLAGAHYKFTDHYIRIYRKAEAYPD
jgi:Cytochrome c554 and c-prime